MVKKIMGNNHGWYIKNIIIDSREKQRGINAYNTYMDKYIVGVQQLEYGDYLFNTSDGKTIVYEYKTCEDFIHSMENQSVFNELSNQSTHHEYSYLIITGNWEDTFEHLYSIPHYRYKYRRLPTLKSRLTKQINGALNRIYSMYVPIIFVDSEEEAFDKMLQISLKVADSKKYGGIVRPVRSLIENPSITYLTRIKGIGEVKATNIANELSINCLEDLCEKKPSDFLSVTKINEENVCNIWKDIHNEELDLNLLK